MPHKKKKTPQYMLIAFCALVVMYGAILLSNTADSVEYKQCLMEKGIEKGADFISLIELTEKRTQDGLEVSYTESTPRYLMWGALVNFLWIASISERLGKNYAQERMYGDAEWGTVEQFKHLRASRRKFYFTNYPPFSYLFSAYIYIKMFKKVWRNEDEEV